MEATMTDTIHSVKSPQFQEQDTFVTIGKVPEDEQITVAETGCREETKARLSQTGYDAMDNIRAWYS